MRIIWNIVTFIPNSSITTKILNRQLYKKGLKSRQKTQILFRAIYIIGIVTKNILKTQLV